MQSIECDHGIRVGQCVDIQPDGEGSLWCLQEPRATAVSCSSNGQVECTNGLCNDVLAVNSIDSAQLLDAQSVCSPIQSGVSVLGGSAWFSDVEK